MAAFIPGQYNPKTSLVTRPFGVYESPRGVGRKTKLKYKSSSDTEETTAGTRTSTSTKVVYQKVVRPPKFLPDDEFLSQLLEYLESYFQLPEELPLPYNSLRCSDEEECSIVAWDYPDAPTMDACRLEVNVVGITNINKKNASAAPIPNKAMVAVRKAVLDSEESMAVPPGLGKLITKSENMIMLALDDGLDDFMEGKIDFSKPPPKPKDADLHRKEVVIEAEVINETDFVKGVFIKAGELLRDRNLKRQERKRKKEKGDKSLWNDGISGRNRRPRKKRVAPKTPDTSALEELREIFETGEKFVDEWISKLMKESFMITEDIDDLVSEDSSGPEYADLLEAELDKLEMCIGGPHRGDPDGPRHDIDARFIMNYSEEERSEATKHALQAIDVLSNLKTFKSTSRGRVRIQYVLRGDKIPLEEVENLRIIVSDATELGLIEDPRLEILVKALWLDPDEDRTQSIVDSYRDFLLSEDFVELAKERLAEMADREEGPLEPPELETISREREIIGELVVYANVWLKEARALSAETEAQQMEILRCICEVVMDPAYSTEEEMAKALVDAADKLRLLWDDKFVAFLEKAIAEEEVFLTLAGLLDDPDRNHWLSVLLIVQHGIDFEITTRINGHIDHMWQAVRMETPERCSKILEKMIEGIPSMDIRRFAVAVDQLYDSEGGNDKGKFGKVTPLPGEIEKFLQLQRDINHLLPAEQVAIKAVVADELVIIGKEKLLETRMIGRDNGMVEKG